MKYYKEEIRQMLEDKTIGFRMLEHPAVYTMQEMQALGILREGRVCKNLFLRDQKGKQHFLVSLPEEKQVSLKTLGERLGGQKLSFASEERLQKYLGVTHGAVSPLGVLNDETHSVTVVLDSEILQWDAIGVHPNDNTATIWLTPEALRSILDKAGNPCLVLDI